MTYIEEEEEEDLHASESSGKVYEQFLLDMKILDVWYMGGVILRGCE